MISGHASPDDPVPTFAFGDGSAPKGGLAAPLKGPIAKAPAPADGGRAGDRGSPTACIVNSGQKLMTPEMAESGALRMVGSGDECEPGGWVVSAVCPKCGHHVQLVKSGCGRVECPRCSKKWARRAAERAAARVFGAFLARASRWKPRHITFDLEECTWDAAKKKAAEIGCTGGVLVLHPWRIKDEYKQMFEMMAERTGMNRYDIAKQSAIGMDAFEWSPHCHGLVYGKFEDVEKGSHEFKYRMIRRMNSQHGAEGALMYLFGHTFIPQTKNGKCYRYFGICSPQKLKPEWTGSCLDSLKCPCCQAEMTDEESGEVILYHKYAALGWHTIKRRPREAKGAAPPAASLRSDEVPNPFKKWAQA